MHGQDCSLAGNPQTVDVFGRRIPYIKGLPMARFARHHSTGS